VSAPQARQPGRGTIPTPAEAAHATSSNRGIGPEKCTGAKSVIRSLEELGADTVFGLPGGAILPVYDPLYDSTFINHVLVRHEQGAGHAAEGYARSTGRVGVCMVTSGPAATNLVTALADAQMDSVPMVAITAAEKHDITTPTGKLPHTNCLAPRRLKTAETPIAVVFPHHFAGCWATPNNRVVATSHNHRSSS